MRKLWWLAPLAATQVVDAAVTLTRGIECEGNPVVTVVWANAGLVGFFALKVGGLIALHFTGRWVHQLSDREMRRIAVPFFHFGMACMIALMAGVCAWGIHLLRTL